MKHLKLEQVAASNYHYLLYTMDYFLNSMERLEVRLIELYAASPHLSILDASDADVMGIGRGLRERGIRVCCLTQEQCVYPINLACVEEKIRSRSIESYFRCIEAAAMLEAPHILAVAGRGYEDLPAEDAWKRAAQSLSIIAERAANRGIAVLLEYVTPNVSNVVNSPESLRRMLDQVSHPALTGMLDFCGVRRQKRELADCLRILGGDVGHIHIADFSEQGRFVPGEGDTPLDRWLEVLDSAGYSGAIAFEVINRQYEFDPHDCMKRCLDYMRRRLGR